MNTNHHRRSIRLKDYDYTQHGAYFVTICAHERMCVFGNVVDGAMVVNTWGRIVADEWEQTAMVRPNIELDAFVVMPNHVHGILVITESVGATRDNVIPAVGATRDNVIPVVGATRDNVIPVGATRDNVIPVVGATRDNVIPAVGATRDNVIPAVGATRDNVIPAVGATRDNVIPAVGATRDNVIPVVGATRDNVIPAVGATRDNVIPAVGATRDNVIPVVGATRRVAPTSTTLQSGSLGAIIGQFKSMVTKRINRLPDAPDHPIWQRNYYEHIIRSEESLNAIRAYIANNPAKWAEDKLFVQS